MFSPKDLGLPVLRERRYTICRLRSSRVSVDYTFYNLEVVAFRRCMLDGGVFFRATQSMVDDLNKQFAAASHLPLTFHGQRWPWSAVLKAGQFRRLHEAMQRKKAAWPSARYPSRLTL